MSVDKYLKRTYNSGQYNCAHFFCEVWEDVTGIAIAESLQGFLCAPSSRHSKLSDLRKFKFLHKPVDPCLVLMQSPRQSAHVGIWIRGKVLHLSRDAGVQYQPLNVASYGFKSVRFMAC